jgi:hypothetical protein
MSEGVEMFGSMELSVWQPLIRIRISRVIWQAAARGHQLFGPDLP